MTKKQNLTLVEHLDELRGRIIKSIISIAICSLILYNCVDSLLLSIVKPVGKLVFIAPQEAFVTKIKLVFFFGFLISLPNVLYQIWQFIAAGLSNRERRYILIFGPLSFLFFVFGALFGYFIIIPIGIRFLLGFSNSFLLPMITVSSYVSFVITLVIAFGAIFELPIAVLFLTKLGLVNPSFLINKRKEAIVIVFIVAAFLTPPDVVTQALMALPLLMLYELSIIFSRIAYTKRSIISG